MPWAIKEIKVTFVRLPGFSFLEQVLAAAGKITKEQCRHREHRATHSILGDCAFDWIQARRDFEILRARTLKIDIGVG